VCAFLEIDPKLGEKIDRADTMVLSDTLNYVDFRKVLSGFVTYLKPDGRLIILNLPHRGNQLLFSDQGPKQSRSRLQPDKPRDRSAHGPGGLPKGPPPRGDETKGADAEAIRRYERSNLREKLDSSPVEAEDDLQRDPLES
jgi:hypothetical protein